MNEEQVKQLMQWLEHRQFIARNQSLAFYKDGNKEAAEHHGGMYIGLVDTFEFIKLMQEQSNDVRENGGNGGMAEQQADVISDNGAMMPPAPTPNLNNRLNNPDMSVHIAVQVLEELVKWLSAYANNIQADTELTQPIKLVKLEPVYITTRHIQSKLTALQTPQEPTEQP